MTESKLSNNNNDSPSPQTDEHTPFYRTWIFWLSILLIFFIIVSFVRHHNASNSNKGRGSQKTPVVVALAKTQDIPVYIEALGSVTPTYSVTVRTQINGQLMRVLFREGQMVKKGDLLAEIDSRPYEAQLTQAQGQLERDQAQLANAEIDLKRYQVLWKQDSTSQQTLATQQALVNQLKGSIKLDEGNLNTIKVSLIYCKIISPVDGRIGLRLVDPGNVVNVSDQNGIAVVNTLNPITVVFSIAEDNIPQVMQQLATGTTLTAEAYDRQQNKLLVKGKLLAVDNQINPSTGTVNLKAQFANDKNILFPSQFVNVRLLVKTLKNSTVVPTAAVQQSTQGNFVYALNKSTLTVAVKPVKVGLTIDGTTVIDSGIKPGDSVIEQGTDKLTDGAKVSLPNTSEPSETKATDHKKRRKTA